MRGALIQNRDKGPRLDKLLLIWSNISKLAQIYLIDHSGQIN